MKFKDIQINREYPFGYEHGAQGSNTFDVVFQTGEYSFNTTAVRLTPGNASQVAKLAVKLALAQLTDIELETIEEFIDGKRPDPELVAKAEAEAAAKAAPTVEVIDPF